MPMDLPFDVQDPRYFTLDNPTLSGSNADKRRAIAKALKKSYRFATTPEMIVGERLNSGGTTKGQAIVAGTTVVRTYYDGSDNTGVINYANPVVFDTVKGFGVTGINPKWAPDEYVIVGKALMDYFATFPEGGYIYMEFQPPPTTKGMTMARAGIPPGGEMTYPDIQEWSDSDPGFDSTQHYVWPMELPSEIDFDPQDTSARANFTGSGQFVMAYNTTRQYVAQGSICHLRPAGEANTKYYFEHWMFPTAIATLDEDLEQGGSVLATLNTSCLHGITGTKILVDDRMLAEGKLLKSGTEVVVSLYRYSTSSVDDFVWRFMVVQANKCPEKPPTGGTGGG